MAHAEAGARDEARSALEEAADIAHDEPCVRADALRELARLELAAGRPSWALVLARRALLLAETLGAGPRVEQCEALHQRIEESLGADPRESTRGRQGALDGKLVLVVDDDDDALVLARAMLGRAGANVVTAGSVQGAMSFLAQSTPDVLLSDLSMPGDDGFSLVRKVRAMGGDKAAIPVIALSAFARPSDRAETTAAGFHGHLEKPVNPEHLVDAIVEATQPRLRAP